MVQSDDTNCLPRTPTPVGRLATNATAHQCAAHSALKQSSVGMPAAPKPMPNSAVLAVQIWGPNGMLNGAEIYLSNSVRARWAGSHLLLCELLSTSAWP